MSSEAGNRQQRQLLWVVLGLNAAMFVVEFTAGWLASSSGLLADSLDMLADALVYSLSLYAVGRGISQKAKATLLNGSLQMVLGLSVLGYVVWRAFTDSMPSVDIMGWVAVLALGVNTVCFVLLFQFRRGDINMRASWICSRNDILANLGVLAAAGLVAWLGSSWPDLAIGALIAAIVIHSSWKIIAGARHSLRTGQDQSSDSCCGD
jgi:Co/Zn/Cd efflux system component